MTRLKHLFSFFLFLNPILSFSPINFLVLCFVCACAKWLTFSVSQMMHSCRVSLCLNRPSVASYPPPPHIYIHSCNTCTTYSSLSISYICMASVSCRYYLFFFHSFCHRCQPHMIPAFNQDYLTCDYRQCTRYNSQIRFLSF